MDFRNMQAFNKALLAKQVWRIIQSPNSLLARLLKGKYFKNKDIMEAEIGYNPSFVWRSIIWGRDLLRKGLCWRVGNGKKILAHKDPWIPSIPRFKCGPSRLADSNIKVDRYILISEGWNEQSVRQSFSPWEAEAILDIPLNRRGSEDSRFWKGSIHGKYSVKEGYFMEMNFAKPPECQSMQPFHFWWKFIWNLEIPPKGTHNQDWQPPLMNQLRMDVDAGFDVHTKRYSVGAVIRDSHSQILGASAGIIRNPGSIKGAELNAIRLGMDLCLRLGLSSICIFSDSIQAINSCIAPVVELGPNGVLALEIQALLDTDHFISLQFTRRSSNKVAHSLARKAFTLSSFVEWNQGNIPCWLYNIVTQDLRC